MSNPCPNPSTCIDALQAHIHQKETDLQDCLQHCERMRQERARQNAERDLEQAQFQNERQRFQTELANLEHRLQERTQRLQEYKVEMRRRIDRERTLREALADGFRPYFQDPCTLSDAKTCTVGDFQPTYNKEITKKLIKLYTKKERFTIVRPSDEDDDERMILGTLHTDDNGVSVLGDDGEEYLFNAIVGIQVE